MSEQTKTFPWRAVIQMVLIVIVAPLLPMLISGRWDWWQAWVYALLSILSFAVSRALAARRHPDLISERARFMEAKDTKPWDKVLAPLLGLGSVVILIVAGLDKLFGWSSAFSLGTHIISVIAILLGYAFSSWALIENRFFSGTVRIQTERGHHVVSTGPYKLVRHPGYAGGLFGYVFIPLLLDSLWAFVPTILLAGVMILRTALEDRTLQAELPGYREFAQKTKYRLISGIW
ncbi:MAG: isoprenylcysteine carboxylmethyltransferase family protein [Chloroflexi bacterium]|nr:isoprenylcysteine carboxylmethyltransferase family protein [Chloroflexota bacterium]